MVDVILHHIDHLEYTMYIVDRDVEGQFELFTRLESQFTTTKKVPRKILSVEMECNGDKKVIQYYYHIYSLGGSHYLKLLPTTSGCFEGCGDVFKKINL